MSRTQELREAVRPIVEKFRKQGYTITDVTSVGLLMVRNWEPNQISKYIALLAEPNMDADAIVDAAEADSKEKRRRPSPPETKSA